MDAQEIVQDYERLVKGTKPNTAYKMGEMQAVMVLAMNTSKNFVRLSNDCEWYVGHLASYLWELYIKAHPEDKRMKSPSKAKGDANEDLPPLQLQNMDISKIRFERFHTVGDMLVELLPEVVAQCGDSILKAATYLRGRIKLANSITREDLMQLKVSLTTLALMWAHVRPSRWEFYYRDMRRYNITWNEIWRAENTGDTKKLKLGMEIDEIMNAETPLEDNIDISNATDATGRDASESVDEVENLVVGEDVLPEVKPEWDQAEDRGEELKTLDNWHRADGFHMPGDKQELEAFLNHSKALYDVEKNNGCPPGVHFHGFKRLQDLPRGSPYSVLEQIRENKRVDIVLTEPNGSIKTISMLVLILDFENKESSLSRRFVEPTYGKAFYIKDFVLVLDAASFDCVCYYLPGVQLDRQVDDLKELAYHMVHNTNKDFPGEDRVRTASGIIDLTDMLPKLDKNSVLLTNAYGAQVVDLNKMPSKVHLKNFRTKTQLVTKFGTRAYDVVGRGKSLKKEELSDKYPHLHNAVGKVIVDNAQFATQIANQLFNMNPGLGGMQHVLKNHDKVLDRYPLSLVPGAKAQMAHVNINYRTGGHYDGNLNNTFNMGSFFTFPNKEGESVAGCHYGLLSVKEGEAWFAVEGGDHLGHVVGNPRVGMHGNSSAVFPDGSVRMALMASISNISAEMYASYKVKEEVNKEMLSSLQEEEEQEHQRLADRWACTVEVVRFIQFIREAISFQNNVEGGKSLDEATSNVYLRQCAKMLMPIDREKTKMHRFVLEYLKKNKCNKLHEIIWGIGLIRNLDRADFFNKECPTIPKSEAELEEVIAKAKKIIDKGNPLFSKDHQRGSATPKALDALQVFYARVPALVVACETKSAETFFVAMKDIPTYGDFFKWIITADLIMLGFLNNDWVHLQQGSLRGRKLVVPDKSTHMMACVSIHTTMMALFESGELMNPYERSMGLIDVEHGLCEYNKFHRVKYERVLSAKSIKTVGNKRKPEVISLV